MRYYEIINEDDTTSDAKETLIDVVSSLVSQNVSKISVDQLLDLVQNDIEASGINYDKNFVIDTLKELPSVKKIEPDDNGNFTVFLGNSEANSKTEENSEDHVKDMASRSLDRYKNK